MTKKARRKAPQLRFPEFNGDWKTDRSDHFLVRYVNPVDVQLDTEYKQIGIRSHGKGIFHKEPVTGRELGNKRVYWVHPEAFTVNIVFAWEQAVALTSDAEEGFIASHRFLMFLPKENRCDLKFILLFFLRKRGKSLLELASPGGAGRNKTLGQDNFAELQLTLPQKEEQEKIASFLGAVDTRLSQLRRKHELLQTYKRGVMQKIFSQQIRFKSDRGKPFPDWEKKKLEKIANITMGQSPESESYNSKGIGKYLVQGNADIYNRITRPKQWTSEPTKLCENGDLILTVRAPIGMIAKSNVDACIGRGVCSLKTLSNANKEFLYQFLVYYEPQWVSLGQGSTFTAINAIDIKSLKVSIPCIEEQKKIANFLTAIDQKIEAIAQQIDLTEQYKKSLLQKMFV
ncbi:restriction endonuclease subunit S [Microcoleus sp. MOSTC5]|uniref:restriction endonuclease subunit S n=1 Tax=Microcoleus sp. MOSTC5 TaxID=3055378 RepID=UPI002FCEDF43